MFEKTDLSDIKLHTLLFSMLVSIYRVYEAQWTWRLHVDKIDVSLIQRAKIADFSHPELVSECKIFS